MFSLLILIFMHRIACTERVLLIFPRKNYGEGFEYKCRNMTASVEISINFTLKVNTELCISYLNMWNVDGYSVLF